MERSYYIETFGCQMNKGDSDLMALSLSGAGFLPAPVPEEADILVFNTCSVREHAENRALARIRSARSLRKKGGVMIVVAGCMAQNRGTELVDSGIADLVVGPYQSPALGEILRNLNRSGRERVFLSSRPEDLASRIPRETLPRDKTFPWHQWVTITHGCGNFCSYCIVPYVRGPLVSFPSGALLRHIRLLPESGITEITLLGQNVNQYGQDSGDLPFYRLLEETARIKGLERIGFLTSHPRDFDENILRVIADYPNISRSLHLPLQSGSDRVLSQMNRHYTMSHYRNIARSVHRLLESYSLSTDLIVGFPGEREEDFRATLDAVREVRFDEAFTYAYSPREGTAAARLREELTREEKIARLEELIRLQREISREKLLARIDRTEEMIVESLSRKSPGEVMGKTFLNHPVVLPGTREDIGRFLKVRITGLRGSTLYGEKIA